MKNRRCSRTGCSGPAVATLTFAYTDSTAVVGPLALRAEPGCYDLCATHCESVSAPRGWDLIRLPIDADAPAHSSDDLLALAEAVRVAGFSHDGGAAPVPEPTLGRRKGHLAVVAGPPALDKLIR